MATTELGKLHARGDLELSQWNQVRTRLSPPKDIFDQQILLYSGGVLDGSFPNRDFFHRRYLNSDHWVRIAQVLRPNFSVWDLVTARSSTSKQFMHAQLYCLLEAAASSAPNLRPPKQQEVEQKNHLLINQAKDTVLNLPVPEISGEKAIHSLALKWLTDPYDDKDWLGSHRVNVRTDWTKLKNSWLICAKYEGVFEPEKFGGDYTPFWDEDITSQRFYLLNHWGLTEADVFGIELNATSPAGLLEIAMRKLIKSTRLYENDLNQLNLHPVSRISINPKSPRHYQSFIQQALNVAYQHHFKIRPFYPRNDLLSLLE